YSARPSARLRSRAFQLFEQGPGSLERRVFDHRFLCQKSRLSHIAFLPCHLTKEEIRKPFCCRGGPLARSGDRRFHESDRAERPGRQLCVVEILGQEAELERDLSVVKIHVESLRQGFERRAEISLL